MVEIAISYEFIYAKFLIFRGCESFELNGFPRFRPGTDDWLAISVYCPSWMVRLIGMLHPSVGCLKIIKDRSTNVNLTSTRRSMFQLKCKPHIQREMRTSDAGMINSVSHVGLSNSTSHAGMRNPASYLKCGSKELRVSRGSEQLSVSCLSRV